MKLIVGLGNPGKTYARNRHNIGFMCVRYFARTHDIKLDKKQGRARTGTGEVIDSQLTVARPQTYMNLSGESVERLVRKLKINLDDLIVIHDDLDLPMGKIRVRRGGSSGGHKGITSIIVHLDSPDFLRIRVGIGRPFLLEESTEDKEGAVVDYVLNDFTSEEEKIMDEVIPKVSRVILCLLSEGMIAAMNKYN